MVIVFKLNWECYYMDFGCFKLKVENLIIWKRLWNDFIKLMVYYFMLIRYGNIFFEGEKEYEYVYFFWKLNL